MVKFIFVSTRKANLGYVLVDREKLLTFNSHSFHMR